jgi:hypothetical protein
MIYIIHCDGYCKIGYSSTPEKRLSELQVGSPHPLTMVGVAPGTRDDEVQLHMKYADFWIRGEWFLLTAEDVREIVLTQSLMMEGGLPPLERPVVSGRGREVFLNEWADDNEPIDLD